MVVHDSEFAKDLTKLSDSDLHKRRLHFVSNLYNGMEGSMDNVEKKALIREIDVERERRYKKRTETISFIAIILSIISFVLTIQPKIVELFNKFSGI